MKDKIGEVLISEYLNVTDVCSTKARWTKKWAQLVDDVLYVYPSSKSNQHQLAVNVKGLDIQPAVKDTGRILAFKLVDKGKVVLVLEPLNVKDMGRWISSLFAAIQGISSSPAIVVTSASSTSATNAQETDSVSAKTNGSTEPQGMELVARLDSVPYDTDVIFRQTTSVRSSSVSEASERSPLPPPSPANFLKGRSLQLASPSPSLLSDDLRLSEDASPFDDDDGSENYTVNVKHITRKFEQLAVVVPEETVPKSPSSASSMKRSSSEFDLLTDSRAVQKTVPKSAVDNMVIVESSNASVTTAQVQQPGSSTSLRRTRSMGRMDRSTIRGDNVITRPVKLRRSTSLSSQDRIKCWSGPYKEQDDEQTALCRVNPFLAKRRLIRREREIQRLEADVRAINEKLKRLNKILAETKFTCKELKSVPQDQVAHSQIAQLEHDAAVIVQQIAESEQAVSEYRILINDHEEEMMSLTKAINWDAHFVVDDTVNAGTSRQKEGDANEESTQTNGKLASSDEDEASDLEENAPIWAREAQRKAKSAFKILASKGILQ